MIDRKIKILVIDDDTVDRMSMVRCVRQSGYECEVVTATSCEEGVKALRTNTFDCVFLDYNLPDTNGFEFLEQYQLELKGAPVIVVTSQGDEKLAVEAMRLGACDYLPKQLVSPEGISQSIRYALRISEEKRSTFRAERALHDSQRKLETIISSYPIIIWDLNKHMIFTMFKGHGVDLINVNPTDVIGQPLEIAEKLLPFNVQLLRDHYQPSEYTIDIESNGRVFEVTCTPKFDAHGEPDGIMGIATDITDFRDNEKQLQEHLNHANELRKVKEQFLANMSHEIRTPIHGIMSLSNLLLKSQINAEQLTYLNAIKKSADNLLVIINDILDISKIEAQKMTFESTIFSVQEIVSTSWELFKGKTEEKGISILKSIDECLPEYVKGDPTRLSQIINNLVNNAIKFTHHGHVEIAVNLTETNQRCSMITFCVKDTGIGIAQNKLSTIFEMFTQAEDDTNRIYGGTGLGLSIVKELVELQGGIIKVTSTLGSGTCFCLSIPFDHPDPAELEAHHKVSEQPESRIDTNLRILVVEDNDINRLVINRIMKDWGVKIVNAINGVEALEKLKENEIDLVLMDIEMPEMNGYQCIREIRQSLPEPKNAIPVMAMTAHANKKEREKCINLGMNDYISKPFDPLDLKQKIVALTSNSAFEPFELDITKAEEIEVREKQRLTNLSYLKELSEGNESFFTDFIRLFLTSTPETMHELGNAITAKDWERTRQASHKMKPSYNYLGLKEAHALASSIEQDALNKTNLESMADRFHKLAAICHEAFEELEQELKTTNTSN
jgi:signal transduction histidine kinase/DNA-binding NarL/FixJ family response regulator